MGREATKAIGNPWYEARMEAAKWDDRLLSREGAAELLGMSVSAVADAELNLTKCMPPDKAVQMADLYKAPHLLNYYCLHECPIGKDRPVSEEVVPIERVTVKLLKGMKLDRLDDIKDRLMDIAAAGTYKPTFEEFWNAYPKKEGKAEAYKKYNARLKDGWSEIDLLRAAKNYAYVVNRQRTEMQYIKHAKTFLSENTPFTDFLPKKKESDPQTSSGSNPFAEYKDE